MARQASINVRSEKLIPLPVTWLRYILSILQAFFGVQSAENRERDFEQGNPVIFFVLAIVITIMFMASLFLFVNYIVLDK